MLDCYFASDVRIKFRDLMVFGDKTFKQDWLPEKQVMLCKVINSVWF